MKAGNYRPAPQLASLLPSHEDMNLMLEEGCGGNVAAPLNKAIRHFIAEIINNPNDAELWHDLSRAFGLWHLSEWKFIYVAHRIDPENSKYIVQLAVTYFFLGDRKQAVSLLNKALSFADNEEDRISIIDLKMRMETNFDDRLEITFH